LLRKDLQVLQKLLVLMSSINAGLSKFDEFESITDLRRLAYNLMFLQQINLLEEVCITCYPFRCGRANPLWYLWNSSKKCSE
jgi:hypothetical protein